MQQKLFKICIFLFCASIFAMLFPYPIFSSYTNITKSELHQINSYRETEIENNSKIETKVLNLDFDQVDALIPIGSNFEIYDISIDETLLAKRIGGYGHFDIIFVDLSTNLDENSNPNYHSVVIKFNENCLIPASLNPYAHGYSDKEPQSKNFQFGHYCLHFKNSKLSHSNKTEDYHQKAVKQAYRYAKKHLLD